MAEGLGGSVTLTSEANESRQLQGMGRHMLDDPTDFHSPTLVNRRRNISRHILVKAVADHANSDGWKILLFCYRKSSEAFHVHRIGKRRQLLFLFGSANHFIGGQKHFRFNRLVFVRSHEKVAGTFDSFWFSQLLNCAGCENVANFVCWLKGTSET